MRRYRTRQHKAGLRVSTHWRPAVIAATSPGLVKHRIIEARSLAMHCLIARKIGAELGLLAIARRNVAAWAARYGDSVPRALEEWRAILDAGESASRLRQSSPFAGVLTPAERRRVYEAFRA